MIPRGFAYALGFLWVGLAPAVSAAAGAAGAAGAPAAAAGECPDGWFCEPNAGPLPQPPSPPGPPGPPGPAGPAGPAAASPSAAPESAPRPAVAPDAAYYPPLTYPDPPGGEVDPRDQRPSKRRRGFREWGFNLHLEGALLADQPQRDQTLGGLGFGFRYRVLPPLAFEAGVDLLRGPEHQGYYRSEVALLLNALVFFNPRDVVQVYGLAGMGLSRTNLNYVHHSAEPYFKRSDEQRSFFGGQLGLGVEVRVSRRIAIAADLVGFIRGRTDDHASVPELNESDSRGGGVLRAGVTFYW